MPDARKEHPWLQRLAGEWTFEMEAEGAPGEPTIRETGTESVRSLGGVWVQGETVAPMPDGGDATNILTLGYDPAKGRYTGTFVSSMMTNLWVYEGEMDSAGVLTLATEGPSYTGDGTTANYRDTIELRSDDERVHTSSYQTGDGTWHRFMTITYRRIK